MLLRMFCKRHSFSVLKRCWRHLSNSAETDTHKSTSSSHAKLSNLLDSFSTNSAVPLSSQPASASSPQPPASSQSGEQGRPQPYTVPCVHALAEQLNLSDSASRDTLHRIVLEYSDLTLSAQGAPQYMQPNQWLELLQLPTEGARRRYFSYLTKREFSRQNDSERRRRRSLELSAEYSRRVTDLSTRNIQYGLGHNTFLIRVCTTSMNMWSHLRVLQAMQFGCQLVFDMGFEANMNRRELRNTCRQMAVVWHTNRAHIAPFDLHLVNMSREGSPLAEFMHSMIPGFDRPTFPLTVHHQSAPQVFPKERLVYLTPHCREELTHFDAHAIYIVGALVDLGRSVPHTMAYAKQHGIPMRRLPLTKYLNPSAGFNPSLTLVAMMSIMLELKMGKSWPEVLQHVPKRGLMTDEECRAIKLQQAVRHQERQRRLERKMRSWKNIQL